MHTMTPLMLGMAVATHFSREMGTRMPNPSFPIRRAPCPRNTNLPHRQRVRRTGGSRYGSWRGLGRTREKGPCRRRSNVQLPNRQGQSLDGEIPSACSRDTRVRIQMGRVCRGQIQSARIPPLPLALASGQHKGTTERRARVTASLLDCQYCIHQKRARMEEVAPGAENLG